MTRFGNKISHAGNRCRRTWKPNAQKKRVKSEVLGEEFRFWMTARVIKTIKRFGGFDQYLLRTRDEKIRFPKAIELKKAIKKILQDRGVSSPQRVLLATDPGKLASPSAPTQPNTNKVSAPLP